MRWLNRPFPFLAPLLCSLTFAQEPPPAQEIPTFQADANLVVLHASVVDKNGKLLTNVPQAAFQVFENGVEQPLKIFLQAPSEPPLAKAILKRASDRRRA
jgi:hypothetical protein